ncbi:MAG: FtsQ-type POTRA domain-containing protein [Bacteroidetes bacterium]|nr:FtsQ-type POTRA domain-containing protein [Bacteroidota bacterium]
MSIKKIILILIVLFVIVSAFMSLKWRNINTIDKVTVTGNYTVTREEILNAARIKDTISEEDIDIDKIQDRIMKHPELKKVFVSKVLPSELKIEVIERRPLAIINGDNEMKLIDDELDVFPFKNSNKLYDLPVISGVRIESSPNQRNRYNKEDLRLALFIILSAYKESKTMYNNISEVNLSDSGKIIVYLSEDSSPFYFPRNNSASISDPEYQTLLINKLTVFDSYIRQSLDIHLKKKINYVDLRYSDQILVNSNN